MKRSVQAASISLQSSRKVPKYVVSYHNYMSFSRIYASAANHIISADKTALKLHYSQTELRHWPMPLRFKTALKLHYSQTSAAFRSTPSAFKTALKLHYSQTGVAGDGS